MKKRSIGIIIGLMTFALTGVVAMQLYFLVQSYNMQSKLFDGSVHEALNTVVDKLNRRDAVNFIKNKVKPDYSPAAPENQNHIIEISDRSSAQDNKNLDLVKRRARHHRKLALLQDSLKRMLEQQKLAELANNLQVRIEGFTDDFGIFHIGGITPEIKNPATADIKKSHQRPAKYQIVQYIYTDPQFGPQLVKEQVINPAWLQEQQRIANKRRADQIKKLIEEDSIKNMTENSPKNAIQNVVEEYQKSGEPLQKRLGVLDIYIDTLLRQELHDKGIYSPFICEVSTANTDSIIYSKAVDLSGNKQSFTTNTPYQSQIFSKEVINDPGVIKVYFPPKTLLILGTMTATMASTAGLLLVLIFCFAYTIFSIIRQKKISEMKTDFINNMTHEFKTPVSTIMIASEALKDNEITSDKSRISRLANIIYEENARLGSHIERVLNIAKIDKNDFKLDKKPLDVNEMISVVVDSMALKLQKFEAVVTLELLAEDAVIKADELHFSNVLYNLVDNAIKYSEGAPHITISTLNRNGGIVIKVADKGIGMTRDQQVKIFEQFYRVPTGNLHNVKGFGLGLSYVNTIVKKLNGTINVKSEKDKGSEFELKFQLA